MQMEREMWQEGHKEGDIRRAKWFSEHATQYPKYLFGNNHRRLTRILQRRCLTANVALDAFGMDGKAAARILLNRGETLTGHHYALCVVSGGWTRAVCQHSVKDGE